MIANFVTICLAFVAASVYWAVILWMARVYEQHYEDWPDKRRILRNSKCIRLVGTLGALLLAYSILFS